MRPGRLPCEHGGRHRVAPHASRTSPSRRTPMTASCGCVREAPPEDLSLKGHAVRARRPLRRRLATISRPARVRIRSRKPCTRARRRLFGWKVRLPLATAFSSFVSRSKSPGHPSVKSSRPRSAVGLAAGPARFPMTTWVAAVSPTFGRLFEGTDEPCLGQTCPPAALVRHRRTSSPNDPSGSLTDPTAIPQNGWQPYRKTVSFLQCRARLGRRPTTKQGSRTHLLPRRPPRVVSGTNILRAVADELQPAIILYTAVHNYVDSCFVVMPLDPGFARTREMRR